MNRVWRFLDNKKSAIGATAGALLTWAIIAGVIDDNTAMLLSTVITVWSGVAVGHKIQKGAKK